MGYGKPFGVSAAGGVTLVGLNIGYGWIVFGALALTIGGMVAIRYFFRRKKSIGE